MRNLLLCLFLAISIQCAQESIHDEVKPYLFRHSSCTTTSLRVPIMPTSGPSEIMISNIETITLLILTRRYKPNRQPNRSSTSTLDKNSQGDLSTVSSTTKTRLYKQSYTLSTKKPTTRTPINTIT